MAGHPDKLRATLDRTVLATDRAVLPMARVEREVGVVSRRRFSVAPTRLGLGLVVATAAVYGAVELALALDSVLGFRGALLAALLFGVCLGVWVSDFLRDLAERGAGRRSVSLSPVAEQPAEAFSVEASLSPVQPVAREDESVIGRRQAGATSAAQPDTADMASALLGVSFERTPHASAKLREGVMRRDVDVLATEVPGPRLQDFLRLDLTKRSLRRAVVEPPAVVEVAAEEENSSDDEDVTKPLKKKGAFVAELALAEEAHEQVLVATAAAEPQAGDFVAMEESLGCGTEVCGTEVPTTPAPPPVSILAEPEQPAQGSWQPRASLASSIYNVVIPRSPRTPTVTALDADDRESVPAVTVAPGESGVRPCVQEPEWEAMATVPARVVDADEFDEELEFHLQQMTTPRIRSLPPPKPPLRATAQVDSGRPRTASQFEIAYKAKAEAAPSPSAPGSLEHRLLDVLHQARRSSGIVTLDDGNPQTQRKTAQR